MALTELRHPNLVWSQTLMRLGGRINDAVNNLEESGLRIILVIDDNNKFIGTLTDGDIRRGLINGKNFGDKIDELISRHPIIVSRNVPQSEVLEIMKRERIQQVPIISETGIVLGLHIWDDLLGAEPLENTMLIMAGGKGVRLRPHTENCPKPMLEINGRPIIERIIHRASESGFSNFIISVNYLGHMIEEFLRDGSHLGVNISYLRENEPLGTAGCLSLLSQRPEQPFLVTNGDVLTDVNYADLLKYHASHEASATMAVREYEIQNPYGVVKSQGHELVGFEEKPVYRSQVNAGIYVIDPLMLDFLETDRFCDMPSFFARIQSAKSKVVVYSLNDAWLDIGRPADLEAAERIFKEYS
ncbi:nucleotidyltransferase family protein [Alphaproteobacteria bacterium]|nr:nucleotidyltransferase family protein [Alphaproteobacteria bacterium]